MATTFSDKSLSKTAARYQSSAGVWDGYCGGRHPENHDRSAVAAGAGWEWNVSVDYQQRWSARASVSGFGEDLCAAWASDYCAWAQPDPDDLVIVDPGNGFSYLFDLAGTLRGESCSRAPRVVGVWGLSRPREHGRDHSRMRGHPRPGRSADDRGHLISCAAGGGYDIKLVPMDAALNRG